MPSNKLVTGAAAIIAAGALIATGAALAGAATGTATPSPSASGSPSSGQPSGHAHTPVTGDELAKVTAAVKAKDSTVTVTTVQKDPDGSYDVHGTKAGAPVHLDVTADLKTITTHTGGGRGGGAGGHAHTPVTGDELAKVTAAVKAKDSTVTVTTVQKDPDGSYDVHGTKAGAPVHLDVTADLKTITTHTGGGRGGGAGGHAHTPVTGDELAKVTAAVKAKDSTVTVTTVQKDPDGSYDVEGTKAGASVRFDVSADLRTITAHTGGRGGPTPDNTPTTTSSTTSSLVV